MPLFHLKILTPSSKAMDDKVVSIVVPGDTGYMGALANHAPIISNLSPGKLKATIENNEEHWFKIGGGILRIVKNNAVVLAESVEEIEASQEI